ncbi:hypothetical protein LTR53_002312 [Teratosphaeriaceae sp. CCFEE 6253]|nr:hypothetical protein LTR53_002312 [Teratosphaeriaceae sp. CCFEE 6253]
MARQIPHTSSSDSGHMDTLDRSVAALNTWFDAVAELFLQHQYPAERIYNMDESRFAIGTSQSSRALVNVREQSSWKVVKGRQEWLTAIECVSAAFATTADIQSTAHQHCMDSSRYAKRLALLDKPQRIDKRQSGKVGLVCSIIALDPPVTRNP